MPKVYEDGKVVLPYITSSKYDRKLVNDVLSLILRDYEKLSADGASEKEKLISKITSDCLIPLYSKDAWTKIKQISKDHNKDEFKLEDDVIVNKLRKNVLNSKPFDFNKLKNKPNLLSLWASISYMTKEMPVYAQHLYSLNIYDLSVPFCLWGALYGFSAFDKRYSEIFYLSEKFEDLKKIYSNLLQNGKFYSEYHYDDSLFSQDDAVYKDIIKQILNSMVNLSEHCKKITTEQKFQPNPEDINPKEVGSNQKEEDINKVWSEFLDAITKSSDSVSPSLLEKNFKLLKLKDNKKAMTVAKKAVLYKEVLNILKNSPQKDLENNLNQKFNSDDSKNYELIKKLIFELIKEAICLNEDKYKCFEDFIFLNQKVKVCEDKFVKENFLVLNKNAKLREGK